MHGVISPILQTGKPTQRGPAACSSTECRTGNQIFKVGESTVLKNWEDKVSLYQSRHITEYNVKSILNVKT